MGPTRPNPYCRSRVTPGTSATMASRVPVRTLKRVDLPTLGRPTSAMTGSTFLPGRYWRGDGAGSAAGADSADGADSAGAGSAAGCAGAAGFATGSDGDGGPRRCSEAGTP